MALTFFNAASRERERTRALGDRALLNTAHSESEALRDYFGRARSVILVLAQSPALRDLGASRGAHDRSEAGDEANAALGYLEQLYPSSIGEVCLIDDRGVELARVVRGARAHRHDLSRSESDNAFFARTFALASGGVHQAMPYESPDTGEWVISNSTRLPRARGSRPAMVHFEVTIESFREAAGRVDPRMVTRVVDPASRRVVFDSRFPQRAGASLGRRADPALLAAVERSRTARSGVLASVGGDRAAIHRVPASPGNVNRWSVVVTPSAAVAGEGWRPGTDTLGLLLAGLAFLTLAFATFRTYARTLRRAALTDDLTHLPNRALLLDRAQNAIHQARRSGRQVAALVLDLNRFKEINDTLGHHEGDRLLLEVAKRLSEAVRASDTVARLGGDEFAVLAVDLADPLEAVQLAERIDRALTRPVQLGGVEVDVTASIGIALFPDHGEDVAMLLKRGDIAMYEAKRSRLVHTVYATELDPYTTERLALVAELRRAIEQGELHLHYQPKYDVVSGGLSALEALVRWEHPVRGSIPPGEFISVAEHTGLIRPLTEVVLDQALAQIAIWSADGHAVPVSVNLSARSLLDDEIPRRIGDALARHGVPAELLSLEITESQIMEDPTRALAILRALDAMGIRLSIDDFGTGYSSLAYLKQLPVSELKIDRSFVMSMSASDEDAAIVRSTIDLGHNLGLEVVAEGVEDQLTLDALRRLDCDIAQGYLLARPQAPEAITALLAGAVARG